MTVVDVVRILRRNVLLLAVCALVGALVGMGYQATRPVVYTARATGMVVAGDSASVGGALSGNTIAQQRAGAYVTLIDTRAVAQKTKAILDKQGIPEAADGTLKASTRDETSFIDISATGSTARNAQALANAGLQALISEALRMETYGQANVTSSTSDAEMTRLTSVHVLGYESAGLPSGNRGRGILFGAGIGLAAGLILGAVIAVIRKQFDLRVRDQATVESITGHGVLAVIPDDRKLAEERKDSVVYLSGVTGEAFRQLRTNLRFVKVDDPPRAVVVTSANPGDGKSTVATHLAVVMAQAGEKVVLIDADMRRPVQHKTFGPDAGVGLSQVLAGDVSLDEALLMTEAKDLQVLPAGHIPPNPSELLGSRRMRELVTDLRDRGFFIVVDAPPVLAVTDASLLGTVVDGTILVTLVDRTHRDQVSLVVKRLEQVGAPLLGSVLTRVPRRKMGDALYGYGASGYNSYYRDYGRDGYYTTFEESGHDAEKSIAVIGPQRAGERGRGRRGDDDHVSEIPRRAR